MLALERIIAVRGWINLRVSFVYTSRVEEDGSRKKEKFHRNRSKCVSLELLENSLNSFSEASIAFRKINNGEQWTEEVFYRILHQGQIGVGAPSSLTFHGGCNTSFRSWSHRRHTFPGSAHYELVIEHPRNCFVTLSTREEAPIFSSHG